MNEYLPTIGLEIHAELKTVTKMFCNSKNDTAETRPNINICPVCMGHPGTLPVINKEAVRQVLRIGTAVGGEIADFTEFDRKNYFYPDIPKGYQISQYKHPLVKGGSIAGVAITRIHLEEDTAKSSHDEEGDSLVDFNRAGVPLMELVTEPVIHDAVTAAKFAKELQLLLWYLGVSEANMEKGEMRVEVNVSIAPQSQSLSTDPQGLTLGTKVEVKNLNSFKSVEKAIAYEIKRQEALLSAGDKVVQETRGWDEDKEETFSQRTKEESHDYRYFPDPDLPNLSLSEVPEFSLKNLKSSLPELPWEKRERLLALGLKDEAVEIFVRDQEWGRFFDDVAKELKEKDEMILASNFITSDLKTVIDVEELAHVVRMFKAGDISSRGAKEILKLLKDGGKAKEIAEKEGLIQESREEVLKPIIDEVLAQSEKEAPVEFLIGQSMKKLRNANPTVLRKLILQVLDH